jgi:hypothetical protein
VHGNRSVAIACLSQHGPHIKVARFSLVLDTKTG